MPVALVDDPAFGVNDPTVGVDGFYSVQVVPPATFYRTYPDTAETFTYVILDADLNETGELHPDTLDAPQARTTIQGNANRTLTLTLTPSEATLNPRTDRIQPRWHDTDGTIYPLGVHRIIDLAVADFPGTIEVTLADESAAHHTPIPRSLSWPRGTEISDIIDQLAGLLSVTVDADPTTATIGEPMAFPLGSADWYDVYAKVAEAAGMLPPHFTVAGLWRWRHTPTWDTPDRVLTDTIVRSSFVRTVTLLDSPNVWLAANPAAKGGQIVGRYQLPAAAPNSVERTGVEVIEQTENAGLASQAAADNAARGLAAGSLDDVGGATANTPLDASVELYSSFEIGGYLYRVVGSSVVLRAGEPVTHQLRRVFRDGDAEGLLMSGAI